MTEPRTFNIYCDESCHLEHDRIPVMAWGAVTCEKRFARDLSECLRALKIEHGLKSAFEVKWTKISPAKANFYLALVDLFLADDRLRFRGLVVPDKGRLNHIRFEQSHDDWYYKMYFTLLRPVFTAPEHYRIYLDMKDTQGASRTRKLHEVLASSLYDFDRECVQRVQQIRSHESEILQIADLLIGALTDLGELLNSAANATISIKPVKPLVGAPKIAEAAQANQDGSECSSYTWQVRHHLYAVSEPESQVAFDST